jgi:carbamoyl-phosphate synthase large subunit
VYVIEVNPRSSRTVPYISKVTSLPIVDIATKVILGEKIKSLGYTPGLWPESEYIAIKMPVFSFEKLRGAEISLGPEMKSTGECLGIAKTFHEALYKAFLGAGINLPKHKKMIMTVKNQDKGEAVELGRRLIALGYQIFATQGTAVALTENGVPATVIGRIEHESPNILDLILSHEIDFVINTPTMGRDKTRDGFLIRRTSIETGVTCFTALDTAAALLTSMESDNNDITLVDVAQL